MTTGYEAGAFRDLTRIADSLHQISRLLEEPSTPRMEESLEGIQESLARMVELLEEIANKEAP